MLFQEFMTNITLEGEISLIMMGDLIMMDYLKSPQDISFQKLKIFTSSNQRFHLIIKI